MQSPFDCARQDTRGIDTCSCASGARIITNRSPERLTGSQLAARLPNDVPPRRRHLLMTTHQTARCVHWHTYLRLVIPSFSYPTSATAAVRGDRLCRLSRLGPASAPGHLRRMQNSTHALLDTLIRPGGCDAPRHWHDLKAAGLHSHGKQSCCRSVNKAGVPVATMGTLETLTPWRRLSMLVQKGNLV